MKESRAKLGGASLTTDATGNTPIALKKPAVGYVHGTNPANNKREPMQTFSHSPIKAKGK